jgi:phosphoribosylaminoimidazole carboxylase PurE protein
MTAAAPDGRGEGAVSAARVAIVCGSRSDVPALEAAQTALDDLGVTHELRVISAHRAPDLLISYVADAEARGVAVFICAAGLAAHLPGVVAAHTTRPVIGLPMPGGIADGLDALLSVVQMPKGVPVAPVGVGNAVNAAVLAAQILALGDPVTDERVRAHRQGQRQAILEDPANR